VVTPQDEATVQLAAEDRVAVPPSLAAAPPNSNAAQGAVVPHLSSTAADHTPIHGHDLQPIFEQEDEEGLADL